MDRDLEEGRRKSVVNAVTVPSTHRLASILPGVPENMIIALHNPTEWIDAEQIERVAVKPPSNELEVWMRSKKVVVVSEVARVATFIADWQRYVDSEKRARIASNASDLQDGTYQGELPERRAAPE